jgi:NAD-dependent SIR2 family protein deacetylase
VSERLAELILENQPCIVLSGAGASTESGIPDFRSPTGLWAGFDPREYATLGAFRADPETCASSKRMELCTTESDTTAPSSKVTRSIE